MGAGIGILLPTMVIVYVLGCAFAGLIFAFAVKLLSVIMPTIIIPENLWNSAVKRGGFAGFLFALLTTIALFIDAYFYTKLSRFSPFFGLFSVVLTLFPMAFRLLENTSVRNKMVKIAIALSLSIVPLVILPVVGSLFGKH